jgi:hypothetical protein
VGFYGVTGLNQRVNGLGRAYLHSLGAPKGALNGFSGGVSSRFRGVIVDLTT